MANEECDSGSSVKGLVYKHLLLSVHVSSAAPFAISVDGPSMGKDGLVGTIVGNVLGGANDVPIGTNGMLGGATEMGKGREGMVFKRLWPLWGQKAVESAGKVN